MTAAVLIGSPLLAALSAAHTAVDDLLAVELVRETDDDVLAALDEAERLRRRVAALDYVLVGEVHSRGLGYTGNTRDTAHLLTMRLRIDAREARARVDAALVSRPRFNPHSGETLPAEFAEVAAAQITGAISAEHARTIVRCVQAMPADATTEYVDAAHRVLLDLVHTQPPEVVAKAARHARVVADQDGAPPTEDQRQQRRRAVTLMSRPDGTGSLAGELTAECAEYLRTFLDTHAAPRPATDTGSDGDGDSYGKGVLVRDPRSAAQRNHDALLDGLKRLIRGDDDAATGGVPVTVLLHMSESAWATGRGHATTGHGAIVPAATAVGWAGGDARLMGVVFDEARAVARYSSTRRIFSRSQRLAMAARDRGCTFPGCAAPPSWCEAHHATDYQYTGRTSIDDGMLACGYDHRERIAEGWTTRMIDGVPYWVPPHHLDPERRPVRNTLHDLE